MTKLKLGFTWIKSANPKLITFKALNVAQLKSDTSSSKQVSCPIASLKATKAARIEACTMPKIASGPPA